MNKLIKYLLVAIIGIIAFTSCEKENFTKPAVVVINPADTISFKNAIGPFFKSDCALSGCHNTGANSPDLTESKAYLSLTKVVGAYVKLDDPTNSKIYEVINTGGKMEKYIKNPSENTKDKILIWIKQGTLNN